MGSPLLFLNLGSGIGIPYCRDESNMDVFSLAKQLEHLRFVREDSFAQARILIESGRYLAGPCGWYITHVIDTKESRGKHIAIVASTLNGFARPSLEHLVTSIDPSAPSREPLFYRAQSTPFFVLNETDERKKPLYTAISVQQQISLHQTSCCQNFLSAIPLPFPTPGLTVPS